MTPERFRQVEELFHAAQEGTAAERAALLAQTDPGLRAEVESLLSVHTAGEFLDRPAVQNAPELLGRSTSEGLAAGVCLGPYRIEMKLGEGGMGEVYRAVDTRLGRAVAIKTMQAEFRAHFEPEARAISSLNHPHICALYDVGPNYLVMELVNGETIAALLKNGPLPIKKTLPYILQIAAALGEAHEKGIIHRDLKPGNIMIAKSGVKVLDFGLANSTDETVSARRTAMGTPGYMAPEQRDGKPADARSDIYSFGCLLYEMLTGERVAAQRRHIASRKLDRIVKRCLEENPKNRWQSVAELERELDKLTARTISWKPISAAAALLAIFAAAYLYLHRAPRLTEQDTILLADFANKTGDPVFDGTLRQGLAVELQQSPFLSLVSDQQIQRTLKLMGQPKNAGLTAEIAQQMCERTGSTAVLEGSIAALGRQYVLGLRASNCQTGNTLDEERAVADSREEVLNSLSEIARRFRSRVGESLSTVERYSKPLAEATTPSLDALRAYTTANTVNLSSGSVAAIPFFRRTVEIDPRFAMAHAYLGLLYSTIGESALSVESTTKARQMRDRASDREKFLIDFLYDRQVTGNLEKAYRTLEWWLQTYPREKQPSPFNPLGFLAGLATHGTGRYERAIEASQKEIGAEPDSYPGYGGLVSSYFFLDRFPEAESSLQRASERKLELPNSEVILYNIAMLTGDKYGMDRAAALAKGKHGAEHSLAHAEALGLARSGRLQAARLSSSRAVDLVLQEGNYERAASYLAARAVWETACGNSAEGKKNANAALQLSRGRDVQYAAAFALGISGDYFRSEALAGDLEKRFPEDTFARFTYIPILRAVASLGRGKPADALECLESARRYELAVNGMNFAHYYLGGLHSAYVRGQAFIAARRYAEATAEFQKIFDHRGIVGLDPIGALAHLQLGRVFALSGDKAKAKAAYETFLALWKDADPGIPVFQNAKAEYKRLSL